MNDYTIVDFNSKTHIASIIFNNQTNRPQNIPIPYSDNLYLTGQDLHNYIMTFKTIITKKNNEPISNLNDILALVDKTRYNINNKYIAKTEAYATRQRLLDSSDWTQLLDANETLTEEDKILWNKYRQDLRDITEQPGWPLDIAWPKRPHILGVTIF